MLNCLFTLLLGLSALVLSTDSFAFHIDGDGYYALRGHTREAPGFYKSGSHSAIEQYFRLTGEIRANERTSFFTEFRLFDNPREAYLGDNSRPNDCRGVDANNSVNQDGETMRHEKCNGQHQNSLEPGYSAYTPLITKAYLQYAFNYCLLKVGRRGRDWGMGIFMDSGSDPFETQYSVYDGVTCDINLQKAQSLTFKFGMDKLSESGKSVFADNTELGSSGANENNDDLEQYFVAIESDDRKSNAGSGFTRHIGIYFTNILGDNGQTNIKVADLYTGFFLTNFSFENEIVFRLGESPDPSLIRLGGSGSRESAGDLIKNKVQSIGLAGKFNYTLSRSGSALGPKEYNEGTLVQHSLFLGYAYAPGDEDGYHSQFQNPASGSVQSAARDNNVKAMAFHRNYKPTLILFNGTPGIDSEQHVDGIYDPDRIMNASLYYFGYRYDRPADGSFMIQLASGSLIQSMPGTIKTETGNVSKEDFYKDKERVDVGYHGKDLGFELDVSYDQNFGRDLNIGIALGAAAPGDALKTRNDQDKKVQFALQTNVKFTF